MARGSTSTRIKRQNTGAILRALLRHGVLSRVHLARIVGVSTATITNLVAELVDLGFVVETGTVAVDGVNVGRPQRALRLVADARHTLSIHVDIGQLNIGLVNLTGDISLSRCVPYAPDDPWRHVLEQAADAAEDLIVESGQTPDDLLSVGVAASGLVDVEAGVNVYAPNLNWHQVPVRDWLSERLNLPVIVENNVRAMALGESLFGCGQDHASMAFIYARIGVGAGLVVDGAIYRGGGAGAGEIGHTKLLLQTADGIPNMQTLESLVSQRAIVQAAAQITGQPTAPATFEAVLTAVQRGDMALRALLTERATYMGVALANLVNVFNPALIVLGGMFTHERGLLLPTVERTLRTHAFAYLGDQVAVRVTPFGDDAGMIGAAALALNAYFYRARQPWQQASLALSNEQ